MVPKPIPNISSHLNRATLNSTGWCRNVRKIKFDVIEKNDNVRNTLWSVVIDVRYEFSKLNTKNVIISFPFFQ